MNQFSQQHNTNAISRRGVAMMLVMVAVLVTGAMAVAYFGSRDNSIAISANIASSSKARIVAESGLDLALAILETDASWRTSHIDGVILQDHQLGDETITITVLDAETELPPTESTFEVLISISATVEGQTQITEATATIFPNDDEFDVDYSEFAIFAQEEISMLGISSVQNWVASPNSVEQQLRIGTLATNPMSIQMGSNAQHQKFELYTPQEASSMISATSLMTSQFTDSLPFLAPPPPPTEFESLNIDNEDFDSASLDRWSDLFTSGLRNFRGRKSNYRAIQEGTYEVEELSLTSMDPIEISGDVILIVEEDFTMNNSSITLLDNATLTLHIGGDVEIKTSYIGNANQSSRSWMDPSRVQMYGHEDSEWEISGQSTIKAELYAPLSEIELGGVSTVCGRIAGNTVLLRGAARVLYDPLLDNGGFADTESPMYSEDGSLLSELRQLTQLNPDLIDSIERSLSEYDTQGNGINHRFYDWKSTPTDRPHEVIYMLLVYGVDARRWERIVREMNHSNHSTFAQVVD
ncbi:MAG: hypothetical protein ISR75_04515 [Phycisphaerales bacterium]|nr:hypothetical protein [Planctomycetota bacterium]MBL6997682.1 hypothetical protein [Phycisphaerales bacterium]